MIKVKRATKNYAVVITPLKDLEILIKCPNAYHKKQQGRDTYMIPFSNVVVYLFNDSFIDRSCGWLRYINKKLILDLQLKEKQTIFLEFPVSKLTFKHLINNINIFLLYKDKEC